MCCVEKTCECLFGSLFDRERNSFPHASKKLIGSHFRVEDDRLTEFTTALVCYTRVLASQQKRRIDDKELPCRRPPSDLIDFNVYL